MTFKRKKTGDGFHVINEHGMSVGTAAIIKGSQWRSKRYEVSVFTGYEHIYLGKVYGWQNALLLVQAFWCGRTSVV